MNPERVQIEIADGVADVRLVRADKHNGLDGAMFESISEAIDQLAADDELRAVVLSGEGPSFCAGLDIKSFAAAQQPRDSAAASQAGGDGPNLLDRPDGEIANLAQKVAHGWREQVRVPVIAALHGAVFGGGLQIALGADIRIAAPDTRMSVMEIVHGLIPDMSITQTLPRLVADDVARELVYTGRQVDAQEAHRLGLVTGVDDEPREAAGELAATIAERRPEAVRNAKRLLNEAHDLDAAGALLLESELQMELIGALSPPS
jgi:enoyl-CoA hydratase/carnithine racemase